MHSIVVLYQKYKRAENIKQRNQHWKNYINKHGSPIIEIIHDNLTQNEACKLEIKYIALFGRKHYEYNGILVNESLGGEGGKQGIIVSKETKIKQSLKLKGKYKPKGFGDKIRSNRDHKSAGKKAGISNTNMGHYIKNSNRNTKISEKLKGRIVTWTGDNIIQLDLNNNFIKEWPSIRQAGLSLVGNQGESIRKCLKGLQKTAYGYKWKYK